MQQYAQSPELVCHWDGKYTGYGVGMMVSLMGNSSCLDHVTLVEYCKEAGQSLEVHDAQNSRQKKGKFAVSGQ